jgi:Flp pilus assembly protein CpaB
VIAFDLRAHALPLAALACALVGLAATFGGGSGSGSATVVAVARSVPLGTSIPASALRLLRIDAGDRTPSMLGELSAATGRVALVPLHGGDVLLSGELAAQTAVAPLRAGQRAVTLRLDPSAAPSATELGAGRHVDVVVSTDADAAHPARSLVAAAALEVLTPARERDGMLVLTLRASVREAVELTEAQSFAHDLRVLVRPEGGSDNG